MKRFLATSAELTPTLVNKTVLITGCSSGFGRGLVRRFLQAGWRVVATMRRAEERADLFSDEQQAFADRLLIANLDVTSSTDIETSKKLVESFAGGQLDCLINNAGYALWGPLETCSEQQIREQFEVNLLAPITLTRALLPYLRSAQGTVINVSSVMAFMALPMASSYCASKAAMSMFSESLAFELAPQKVKVYSVEPGGFKTGFMSNSQWGQIDHSAYQQQVSGFKQFQKNLNAGPGKDPAPVINRIYRLANRGGSSSRYPVGNDAMVTDAFYSLVPAILREKLMGRMFRRVMQ